MLIWATLQTAVGSFLSLKLTLVAVTKTKTRTQQGMWIISTVFFTLVSFCNSHLPLQMSPAHCAPHICIRSWLLLQGEWEALKQLYVKTSPNHTGFDVKIGFILHKLEVTCSSPIFFFSEINFLLCDTNDIPSMRLMDWGS